MSDEHEGREPRPDETRGFPPSDDDEARRRAAGNHPDEGPAPSDPWLGEVGTEQMPRTPASDSDDATVFAPRSPQPDATAVQPPAAWAGRAEVRPPGPGQPEYSTSSDWEAVPPPAEPRARWWMPILIGVLALLLLGLLGWGIYLITENSNDDPETPAPAASVPAPAETTTAATTAPTSAAPTTTQPATTEPTATTVPAAVTVPALIGLSRQDAQQALERRGLRYRVISRPSDAAAGTVIDSDPAEGQEVPADTQVTLVIAAERTAPTTPSSSPPPGDQPDGQPGED